MIASLSFALSEEQLWQILSLGLALLFGLLTLFALFSLIWGLRGIIFCSSNSVVT